MKGINYLLNLNPAKIKLGLERTNQLLKFCKNPDKKIKSLQIIGTNGKGSVAAMLNNMLISNHYKVGLFTSPHLVNINERIQVNSQPISDIEIEGFINQNKQAIKKINSSFFEVMTVLAIWYFAQKKVDIAILETGLGGRLDSVTACKPEGLIFTPISRDHQQILGDNIKKIAIEKSFAISTHTEFILSSPQKPSVQRILRDRSKTHKNKITFKQLNIINNKKDQFKYLHGLHQFENGNLAYATIQTVAQHFKFKINFKLAKKSMLSTFWPGRMQILQKNPNIIFDVCHNAAGINALYKYCEKNIQQHNKKYLIVAFESTKKIAKELNELVHLFNNIIITETNIRKSMNARALKNKLTHKNIKVNKNINRTLEKTIKTLKTNDVLFIIGSHFLGTSINKIFKNCFANYKKV